MNNNGFTISSEIQCAKTMFLPKKRESLENLLREQSDLRAYQIAKQLSHYGMLRQLEINNNCRQNYGAIFI